MKIRKRTLFLLSFLLFLAFPLFEIFFQFVNYPIFNQEYIEKTHLPFQVRAEEEDDTEVPDDFSPNTSHLHPQWNHNVMNIGEAWADGYTGKNIKIAVLDTGFYYKHPDISINEGYSVFPDDHWSNDHSGHGTHIAGIISAKPGTTYQGIAPDADIFAIKIYNSNDINDDGEVSTDTDSVRRGIEKAIEVQADIILISSGLDYHDEELYQEIKRAYEQDILIIAASGNGTATVNYPASYKEVVAVTATDERLDPAIDIIYGQENEFAAPGVNIGGLSIPSSKYSYPYIFMSGSSQAAPHAAGLAAILMEKYDLRGNDIRKKMEKYALDIGDEGLFGHGLLYYVSNEEDMEDDPIDLDELEEMTPTVSENEQVDGDKEVRKPSSAREADTDVDDDDLMAYYQAVAVEADDVENAGRIDEGQLPLIEPGGTLEILMNDFNKIKLSEKQIGYIRENNIRLTLKKDEVSWTIPPANLVPGEAILRFYAGVPTGVPKNKEAGPGAYTVSIYQEASRKGSYPSEMKISFDFNNLDYENTSSLRGYYWNQDKEEWRWLASDRNEEEKTFSLEIKNTTAIGFFDSKLIKQEKTEKDDDLEVVKESTFSPSMKWLVQLGVLVILIFSIVLISMKKK